MTILGRHAVQEFERRAIEPETAARLGVYTAKSIESDGKRHAVPDPDGRVIAFPFFEHGRAVACKYRTLEKRFWQEPGGRKTFYNADALDDPGLENGWAPLVIVEGEYDLLTALDCGFPLSVSVPDGAPPPPQGKRIDELDPVEPDDDRKGKFEFLWNNRDRLKRIKRFVIAVDNDPPGKWLEAELVRRLSAARCAFVTYPDGCKDLNDVRMRHGPERVAEVINGAQPYPLRGLYRLSQYPKAQRIQTFSTGWPTLDPVLSIFPGEFFVVTGIPSHGKSSWVLQLAVNLVERHGWPFAVFSPEMPTVPMLRDRLRCLVMRESLDYASADRIELADAWIEQHVSFIDSDPTGELDEDLTLEWLVERSIDAVLRDGVRLLIIDPWNELEHSRRPHESGTDYIGRGIRTLKRFGKAYGVAVGVVAHPTKDVLQTKSGKYRAVTLYDIEGSAHWYNKPDHGVIVIRDDEQRETIVRVAKVRHDGTGLLGHARFHYDRTLCRFNELDLV